MKFLIYFSFLIFLCSCELKTSNYYYNLACDEESKGNLLSAINYLDKVLEMNPNDIQALNNRGFDYLELKKYDLALNDFQKMLEVDQKCPGAYYAIGYLNYEIKHFEKAITYFNKAIQLKGGGPVFLEHVDNPFTKSEFSVDVPIDKVYEYKKLSEKEVERQQMN